MEEKGFFKWPLEGVRNAECRQITILIFPLKVFVNAFKIPIRGIYLIKFDGFVKSPSVPLGAGLRFNPALLDKRLRILE